MDAPTWRGAYDRFLILPQGRLNIIDFYFYGGAAPFPLGVGNVNCTDQIDLADVMYLIYFIKGAIPELCCLNTPAPPGRQRLYTEQVDGK